MVENKYKVNDILIHKRTKQLITITSTIGSIYTFIYLRSSKINKTLLCLSAGQHYFDLYYELIDSKVGKLLYGIK